MKFAIVGAGRLGDMHLKRPRATSEPKVIGPVDAVVVAVKTRQVAEAARAMQPVIGADTTVVPFLKGVIRHFNPGACVGIDGRSRSRRRIQQWPQGNA
jgi:hypothetical protein